VRISRRATNKLAQKQDECLDVDLLGSGMREMNGVVLCNTRRENLLSLHRAPIKRSNPSLHHSTPRPYSNFNLSNCSILACQFLASVSASLSLLLSVSLTTSLTFCSHSSSMTFF
jgi:hypothetical protein